MLRFVERERDRGGGLVITGSSTESREEEGGGGEEKKKKKKKKKKKILQKFLLREIKKLQKRLRNGGNRGIEILSI